MNAKRRGFFLSLGAGIAVCLLATSLHAATTTTIVDDSWADGDLAATGTGGELDTNWWTSSSSSGDEVTTGAMGLVTGTSGRGIHTVFPTQTLDNVGDTVTATYTFTVPATINTGGGNNSAFRVGLFDTLGRTALDAQVNASSGSPNEVYGWSAGNGNPNPTPPGGLPGFMLDMDVYEAADMEAGTDLNFRKHDADDGLFTNDSTGRLMATTSNFDGVSPSGPDAGYFWTPGATYTGSFAITRGIGNSVRLTGTLGSDTYSVFSTLDTDDIGMLGFHVNSRKFGMTNAADDGTTLTNDNGINFSNINIVFSTPEPSSFVLMMGLMSVVPAIRRRK